jgi:hypothetical protein
VQFEVCQLRENCLFFVHVLLIQTTLQYGILWLVAKHEIMMFKFITIEFDYNSVESFYQHFIQY